MKRLSEVEEKDRSTLMAADETQVESDTSGVGESEEPQQAMATESRQYAEVVEDVEAGNTHADKDPASNGNSASNEDPEEKEDSESDPDEPAAETIETGIFAGWESLPDDERSAVAYLRSVAEGKGEIASRVYDSLNRVDGFVEGRGEAVADVDAVLGRMLTMAASLERGCVMPEDLMALMRGQNYERDIMEARTQVEIDGRNARIIEEFRTTSGAEESVPALGGASPVRDTPLGNSIFDLARGVL